MKTKTCGKYVIWSVGLVSLLFGAHVPAQTTPQVLRLIPDAGDRSFRGLSPIFGGVGQRRGYLPIPVCLEIGRLKSTGRFSLEATYRWSLRDSSEPCLVFVTRNIHAMKGRKGVSFVVPLEGGVGNGQHLVDPVEMAIVRIPRDKYDERDCQIPLRTNLEFRYVLQLDPRLCS